VNISTSDFEEHLKKELHLLDIDTNSTDITVIAVNAVNLTSLSMWDYGHGEAPLFSLDYIFMDKHHVANIGIPVLSLYDDFHEFFDSYLKKLFK